MPDASTPALPRLRLPPTGGGNILTRSELSQMLAALHTAARLRLQASGVRSSVDGQLSFLPSTDEARRAEMEMVAKRMSRLIPGTGRVITKATFGKALQRCLAGLEYALDVDGVGSLTEEADGGLALRMPLRYQVYIFAQVEVFPDPGDSFITDILLGAAGEGSVSGWGSALIWSYTSVYDYPEEDETPAMSREVNITYWARWRLVGLPGEPEFDDPDLTWLHPVALQVKVFNPSTLEVFETPTVNIVSSAGVTVSYEAPGEGADQAAEVEPLYLTVLY